MSRINTIERNEINKGNDRVKNEVYRAGIGKNYRPMACVLNWKVPSVFLNL